MNEQKRPVGNVGQRKNGRYYFKLELPPLDGKRRSIFRTFATEQEARDALAVAIDKREKGTPVASGRDTVERVCADWLDKYAPHEGSATSVRRYKDALSHVRRNIGAMRLNALTPGRLHELWVRLLTETSKGKPRFERATVAMSRAVFVRVLDRAVVDGKIAANIAALAKLPKVKREAQTDEPEQVQPFTQEEVSKMLHGLRDRGDGLQLAVALGAGCGLRRGEVLALQWRDIEPDAIHVRGSINDNGERTAPKTESSRRSVAIEGALVGLIAAHRAKATAEAASMGVSVREDDLLFPASPGEPQKPQHPRSFGSRFEYQARKLGIRGAHFHRLRHHQASMLIAANEQPAAVAARLGHKDATITLARYTKAFDEAKARTAATAGAALDSALAWQPVLRRVK